jgi:hypothetical protein
MVLYMHMTPLPLETNEVKAPATLPTFRTLFKRSWQWVFSDWKRLLLCAVLILGTLGASLAAELLNPAAGTAVGAPVTAFLPVMIASVLSMVLSMVVYTYLAVRIVMPVNYIARDAVALTKKFFLPFTIVTLAMSLMMVLGFFALIIPGLLLMAYLSLAPWAVVAEGLQGKSALLRSVDLVRNRFWYVTIQYVLLGLVFLPLILIALGIALASTWYFLMGGPASWWLVPVYVILFLVLYVLPLVFALRFSYEVHQSLVATYVPATKTWWWQGGLFSAVYVIALIVASVVLIGSVANYYFLGQQVPTDDFKFEAAELEALKESYDIQ